MATFSPPTHPVQDETESAYFPAVRDKPGDKCPPVTTVVVRPCRYQLFLRIESLSLDKLSWNFEFSQERIIPSFVLDRN